MGNSINFKIHHVGIAVKDMGKAKETYKSLGAEVVNEVRDEKRKVHLCFMKMNNGYVELVAPLSDYSPVSGFLLRNGSGTYHICYEVDDIDRTIDYLKSKGFILVERPSEAVLFDGKMVTFLYSKDVGLIELIQK